MMFNNGKSNILLVKISYPEQVANRTFPTYL